MKAKLVAATLLLAASPASASVINALHKPNDNGTGSMQYCQNPGRLVWTNILAGPCRDDLGY